MLAWKLPGSVPLNFGLPVLSVATLRSLHEGAGVGVGVGVLVAVGVLVGVGV
jgi:hypothetical protein